MKHSIDTWCKLTPCIIIDFRIYSKKYINQIIGSDTVPFTQCSIKQRNSKMQYITVIITLAIDRNLYT